MRSGFLWSEVWQGFRRNITMTLAMILTTAVSLGMLGGGLLVVKMANDSEANYQYLNEFRVFVSQEVSLADPDCVAECAEIRAALEDTTGVASVEYLDPEETYDEFRRLFEDSDPVLVETTSPDALGSRFTLTLTFPERAQEVALELQDVPDIEAMPAQGELVERVFSVLDGVRNAAFALAFVQLIATVLLIANMTQIAAYTRRDALGIMRLVGASRWTTELPFVIEALIASIVGSLLAVGGLFATKNFVLDTVLEQPYRSGLVSPITDTDILLVAPVIVLAGAAISAVTAWATLRLSVRH